MRRFRFLFLLLAPMVLVPVVLLVQRAVQSLQLERELRHKALAERVFDEMERAVSRVLEQEEARPPAQYGSAIRGPLPPFVLGHFEVDARGEVRLLPADGGAGMAGRGREATIAAIDRAVDSFLHNGRAAASPAQEAQLPGTTVDLTHSDLQARAAVAGREPAERKNEVSAYDAFRALNKAVLDRDRLRRGADTEVQRLDEPGDEVRGLGAGPALVEPDAAPPPTPDLPPMLGRAVDARHLLLHRTLVRHGETYRQGVILDVEALGTWLRQQALGNTGIAPYASVAFTTPFLAATGAAAHPGFSYQHRFGEPLDVLTARLDLSPLPGLGGATYVYALSGLLLASALLGLAALYRMVSVVVGYADRRTNFVAAVSHELKTPLTAIRMYGEMLRDGMVASEAKRDEYYRHITAESERLSRLINNVLELARLENGKRDVALVTGSIAPVVTEITALLRPHVERQGFELRLHVDDDLPAVRFEPDALTQVLSNLIDNAVKYARDSSPRRIELACRRQAGGVCLTLRDHGAGVAPRHLRKIFEPFYRGESEMTRRSKGTGIGLALVRGLAERMGAKVTGRNADGGGFEIAVAFDRA